MTVALDIVRAQTETAYGFFGDDWQSSMFSSVDIRNWLKWGSNQYWTNIRKMKSTLKQTYIISIIFIQTSLLRVAARESVMCMYTLWHA